MHINIDIIVRFLQKIKLNKNIPLRIRAFVVAWMTCMEINVAHNTPEWMINGPTQRCTQMCNW